MTRASRTAKSQLGTSNNGTRHSEAYTYNDDGCNNRKCGCKYDRTIECGERAPCLYCIKCTTCTYTLDTSSRHLHTRGNRSTHNSTMDTHVMLTHTHTRTHARTTHAHTQRGKRMACLLLLILTVRLVTYCSWKRRATFHINTSEEYSFLEAQFEVNGDLIDNTTCDCYSSTAERVTVYLDGVCKGDNFSFLLSWQYPRCNKEYSGSYKNGEHI